MNYRQALCIGNSEGTIQCTYANIYRRRPGGFFEPIFSLQRRNFNRYLEEYARTNNIGNESWMASYKSWFQSLMNNDKDPVATYTGYGEEGIIGWARSENSLLSDATAYIIFDLPLVVASNYSREQYVPVKLRSEAVNYMRRTLEFAKQYPVYDKDGNVDHYTISKRWAQLKEALNSDTTYYVKPAAFRWNPIDIDHAADRYGESMKQKIEVSRKELDRAEKILIAAGFSNIIM